MTFNLGPQGTVFFGPICSTSEEAMIEDLDLLSSKSLFFAIDQAIEQ